MRTASTTCDLAVAIWSAGACSRCGVGGVGTVRPRRPTHPKAVASHRTPNGPRPGRDGGGSSAEPHGARLRHADGSDQAAADARCRLFPVSARWQGEAAAGDHVVPTGVGTAEHALQEIAGIAVAVGGAQRDVEEALVRADRGGPAARRTAASRSREEALARALGRGHARRDRPPSCRRWPGGGAAHGERSANDVACAHGVTGGGAR